jgi:serine/threonine protein kinase
MMHQNSSTIMLSKTTNPRWTAPEVIRDSQIGTAGDVYSFAIIMWELLTWQQPYEEMMSVQVRGGTDGAALASALSRSLSSIPCTNIHTHVLSPSCVRSRSLACSLVPFRSFSTAWLRTAAPT